MSHDLSTESGLFACVEDFMDHLSTIFASTGTVAVGVAAVATRFEGKRLASPKLILFWPNGSGNIDPGFFARAYRRAIDEHRAVGVFTFGEAESIDIEHPIEMEAWRVRNAVEHPKSFRTVSLKLEHTTFGARLWCALISKEGKLGPFELQNVDSECTQGDFFEQLRLHPSTA